jgi:predicted secreted Zn-dependent protease
LNEASPIRENNQTFHGYTKWGINWNFWWDADDEGRCRITSSKTTLTTTVTLPKLSRGNVEQQSQFNRYSLSLKQHELGHYQIGREAAAVIDRMFVSLPAMQDCQILEKTANDTAYQKLETFKAKERLYDTDTEYGKTQGAWLEN